MKNLFKRFDKETGIASAAIEIGALGPGWLKDPIGEVSLEFNKWMMALWAKVGGANPMKTHFHPQTPFRPVGNLKKEIPFGQRVNKFMVRKWMIKLQNQTL